MTAVWLSLSPSWSLEDVQAVLNVVISFLSALAIWTFSRSSWQRGSAPVTKTHNILILSLFSVSSLGDVFDIVQLLKTRALSLKRRPWILAQCVVVTLFSFSAILSGPIARHASRVGSEVTITRQTGMLTITAMEQGQEKIRSALVRWNQTQLALKKARFPPNQLLDFLPVDTNHWLYRENEWNASWTAKCNFTHETPIHLVGSGNRSDYELNTQLTGLRDAEPPARFLNSTFFESYDICGFEENRSTYKDLLLWILRYPDLSAVADYDIAKRKVIWRDDVAGNADPTLSFSLTAVHLHNAPRRSDMDGNEVTFGEGAVDNASYTRVDCDLTRSRAPPNELQYAYPDVLDRYSLTEAYADYYRPGVVQRSISNTSVRPPSPEELFQFYQVYMITKDTQHQYPVERSLTVEIPVVQLSTIFLAFVLALTLLILFGLVRYLLFLRRRQEQVKYVPESKLDWMLHAMKEAAGSKSALFIANRKQFRYQLETAMFGCFEPLEQQVGPMKVQLGLADRQVEAVVQASQPKVT